MLSLAPFNWLGIEVLRWVAMEFHPRLSPEHILQSQQQSHELWHGDRTLERRTLQLTKLLDSYGSEGFWMCGLVDGQRGLVSSLKRYPVILTYHGVSYPTVGIGAVFTAAAFRNSGYANALVRRVLEVEREEKTALALLFSNIDVKFYERMGFVKFPASRQSVSVEDLPVGSALTLVHAVEADRLRMMAWYESNLSADLLRPKRSEVLWKLYRERIANDSDFIIVDHDRPVGYLNAFAVSGKYWVEEWSAEKGYDERVWATIRHLASAANCQRVEGFFPQHQCRSNFQTLEETQGIPMLKVLNAGPSFPDIRVTPAFFPSLDHF